MRIMKVYFSILFLLSSPSIPLGTLETIIVTNSYYQSQLDKNLAIWNSKHSTNVPRDLIRMNSKFFQHKILLLL
jgi:hypothetical protein